MSTKSLTSTAKTLHYFINFSYDFQLKFNTLLFVALRHRSDRSRRLFVPYPKEPKFAMYPKVRGDKDTGYYKQSGSCLNSNHPQFRISENNQEEDSQIYVVAKIPKVYIPSVLISESNSVEMNKRNKGADIEAKQKTKASLILRPRAVVSSPDNDAMIGNINKSEERKAKKGFKSDDKILSRACQRKNVDTDVKKISYRIVAKQSGVSSRDHK